MIDNQQVRLGFLDHNMYRLPSASHFQQDAQTATNIMLNLRFWNAEFTPQDPDIMVLVLQGDAALCRALEYDSEWA
jgi:hypothetical protein